MPRIHFRWDLEHDLYPIPRCLPITSIRGVVGGDDGPDVGHIQFDKVRRLGEGVSTCHYCGPNERAWMV